MERYIHNFLKNRWQLFTLLFISVVLLYGRAYAAGFVTDFTGLHAKMQGKGLGDALNSYGFPSLMPVLNVTYGGLSMLVGLNGVAWFLFFSFVFAWTLILYYGFIVELLSDSGVNSEWVGVAAVLLVLTSPYQVEAMIWKVGLGHLMSVCFLVKATLNIIRYLKSGEGNTLLGMMSYLGLSLLCFEWGLVFPGVVVVLALVYLQLDKTNYKKIAGSVVASVVVITIYLLTTRVVVGEWLGHYDMGTQMNIEIGAMLSTALKYFVKHLGLVHFLSHDSKSVIYGLTHKLGVQIVAYGAVFLLSLVWLLRRKSTAEHRLMVAALLLAFVSLVPVSGLHFSQLQLSENDRYGSLFIYFFSFWLVLLVLRLPRWPRNILVSIFIVLQLFFQQQLVSKWQNSQEIIESLTSSFKSFEFKETDKVLILNLPENMDGIFMFRDYGDKEPYSDYLKMYFDELPEIEVVAQYNLPGNALGFAVERRGDEIFLKAEEWGSWWWQQGLGLAGYETGSYEFMPEGKDMRVLLKKPETYTAILYGDGQRWIEL